MSLAPRIVVLRTMCALVAMEPRRPYKALASLLEWRAPSVLAAHQHGFTCCPFVCLAGSPTGRTDYAH